MKKLALVIASLSFVSFASAQPPVAQPVVPSVVAPATPGIDARQENQAERIQQGVVAKTINPIEQKRLEKQQERIAKIESRMKADGKMTLTETRRLKRIQDHASMAVKHAKHNGK